MGDGSTRIRMTNKALLKVALIRVSASVTYPSLCGFMGDRAAWQKLVAVHVT